MTQDTKDKSAEALSRLEMLLSLGWQVTTIDRLSGSRDEDCHVFIANRSLGSFAAGHSPDLATAITEAIDKAAKQDPTFRDFEKAVS